MKIPKDVDDLMWELSECGDERAKQEFVQRYPQYRAELNKSDLYAPVMACVWHCIDAQGPGSASQSSPYGVIPSMNS